MTAYFVTTIETVRRHYVVHADTPAQAERIVTSAGAVPDAEEVSDIKIEVCLDASPELHARHN